MEGPDTATSATAAADEPWSPRSEARRTASRLSQLEALVRRQSIMVESIIQSVAPPSESTGGAGRDADAAVLAEVAPLTLPRPAASDTSSVRRDLEEELTAVVAESRPPRARQHDARELTDVARRELQSCALGGLPQRAGRRQDGNPTGGENVGLRAVTQDARDFMPRRMSPKGGGVEVVALPHLATVTIDFRVVQTSRTLLAPREDRA